MWLKARKDADDVLMMDAALSVGMAYVALNQPDSARQWLEDAVQWAEALDSPWVTARANQAFGVSAMVDYLDFDGAYGYLFKALEAAEDAEDKSMRYGILIDISMAGVYRQDTSAMKYARAIYDMGVSSGSDFFKYTGSIMMSHFLYLKKDYEQALRMIGKAADLADSFYNHTEVYTLYGNILSALGNDAEASGCFRIAQDYADDTELPVKIYFYLDYGSFLLKTRQAKEALSVLADGLDIAKDRHVEVFTYLFYKSISDSYAQLRDTGKALEYYKRFHEKSDSVFNVESVRTINELQKKYQNEVLERELRDKELVLERERRQNYVTGLFIVVILTVCASLFVIYRRKNKMYKDIVRQYYALRQASEKQEPLQSTVESPSKPSEQRLFEKLDKKMKEEELWRDNELTIDKLAALMNSNRSYVSSVINKFSGKTFNNYVNSFRIDYAVKVLSAVNDDTPLKNLAVDSGFGSLTTFYSSFQKITGVPPAKFRENWKKLSEENVAEVVG